MLMFLYLDIQLNTDPYVPNGYVRCSLFEFTKTYQCILSDNHMFMFLYLNLPKTYQCILSDMYLKWYVYVPLFVFTKTYQCILSDMFMFLYFNLLTTTNVPKWYIWGRRGRDRMVVGFTTTYAIGAHHHWCCGFDIMWWSLSVTCGRSVVFSRSSGFLHQ